MILGIKINYMLVVYLMGGDQLIAHDLRNGIMTKVDRVCAYIDGTGYETYYFGPGKHPCEAPLTGEYWLKWSCTSDGCVGAQ